VDRTARNTNMLVWQEELWLIDHGAALYFHHNWNNYLVQSRSPFSRIKDHTLLPLAGDLYRADENLQARLNPALLRRIVDLIPTVWLGEEAKFSDQAEHRQAYVDYLQSRLAASATFVEEARRARAELV
jgi:hypothetical protein